MTKKTKGNVFIRTVSYFYTGREVSRDKQFITLDHAAWMLGARAIG